MIVPENIERLCKELRDLGKEVGKTGNISKRQSQLKIKILEWAQEQEDVVIDKDSTDKWILRSESGAKKLMSFDGKALRHGEK